MSQQLFSTRPFSSTSEHARMTVSYAEQVITEEAPTPSTPTQTEARGETKDFLTEFIESITSMRGTRIFTEDELAVCVKYLLSNPTVTSLMERTPGEIRRMDEDNIDSFINVSIRELDNLNDVRRRISHSRERKNQLINQISSAEEIKIMEQEEIDFI